MSQRSFVYVDGFNLYYRALAQKPHKWLNLYALATRMLPTNYIVEIRYYTARVSGNRDFANSQFPDPVIGAAGQKIHKPPHW